MILNHLIVSPPVKMVVAVNLDHGCSFDDFGSLPPAPPVRLSPLSPENETAGLSTGCSARRKHGDNDEMTLVTGNRNRFGNYLINILIRLTLGPGDGINHQAIAGLGSHIGNAIANLDGYQRGSPNHTQDGQ